MPTASTSPSSGMIESSILYRNHQTSEKTMRSGRSPPAWAAWKASMICWVTACDEPGLLDQKVISLAGVIVDQSVSSLGASAPPPVEVLGPPQAASAAAVPRAPARPRNLR